VSGRLHAPPAERRLRLLQGEGRRAEPASGWHPQRFRPRPSSAALALTDEDYAAPARGPRLRLVGDGERVWPDPFDVPAEDAPLGDAPEPVWLGEFLERAAAVLRERPRLVHEHRAPLRVAGAEPAPVDRCNVIELHRARAARRRRAGRYPC
jgi:hypothetical protein